MGVLTERDDLLKSLEETNASLTKAFGNYREFNKNQKLPKLNDDVELTPEDSEKIIKIYDDHKKALENINECAANVKKEIEKLEAYYNACEEKQKETQKIIEEELKKASKEDLKRFLSIFVFDEEE
jgi:DNA polymerase III delta prime subunit